MSTKISKMYFSLAIIIILVLVLVSCAPIQNITASTQARGGGQGGGQGAGQSTGVPVTALSDAEKASLTSALIDEYGALNLYQTITAKFGNVAPFSQVIQAEKQHINNLTQQANKYEVTVPVNFGLTNPPVFNTLAEACAASVAAEIANAALYDQLKPTMTHSDILSVFNNLQSASLNKHLPAFKACQ